MKGHLKDYLNIYWIQSREKNQLFELRVLLLNTYFKMSRPHTTGFPPMLHCISCIWKGQKLWLASIHDFFFFEFEYSQTSINLKRPRTTDFPPTLHCISYICLKGQIMIGQQSWFFFVEFEYSQTLIQLKKTGPILRAFLLCSLA